MRADELQLPDTIQLSVALCRSGSYARTVKLPVGLLVGLLLATSVAHAAPPEPTGQHPRILLDDKLRATWRAALHEERGPLIGSVILCEEDGEQKHEGALYMGAEWAKMLQACLVAWAATDKAEYAASAIRYFTALIDDLDKIGDGKGGDRAAIRDSGYAIRNLGPYTAVAYDWLHDLPAMTPALRARARQRWAAWIAAYKERGYHPRDPGSNYHAGFLLAATMIAIAQGGEAAEHSGAALWRWVADELWGKDMVKALAAGGVLDGGDWNEGWQYGPLSVAEYALAARVARAHGIPVRGTESWLASLLRRHVYALTPTDRLWAGGDFDSEEIHMSPQAMALTAVALGDARPQDKQWAKGELSRLKLTDKDWLLYDALATIGERPVSVPRDAWPTWYTASGSATLYARSNWDPRAIWFVATCAKTNLLDHRGPSAGNFALSRGGADLVVDPSPYGSLSTLTGNAPTVLSKHLPANYVPSQGAWGEDIAWRWTLKTRSGVVAARCDYTDAYRFQDRKTDVAEALRDFVLLPSSDGRDASLVIVDRATTGEAERKMYLRFRVPGELSLDHGTGTLSVKDARLAISGTHGPSIGRTALKDCFQEGTKRGNCDAARFPVTDYRVEIPGPAPRAVHVLEATDRDNDRRAAHERLSGEGWEAMRIEGTRDAVVIWPVVPNSPLAYRVPRAKAMTHVVLDAAALDGKVAMSAKLDGDTCAVTIAPGGKLSAAPLIATLDDACNIMPDLEQLRTLPVIEDRAPVLRSKPGTRRGGCCGAQSTPMPPIAMSLAVLALVLRRRRR